MDRRIFLASAPAFLTCLRAAESPWDGPVLDIHLHPRSGEATEAQHLQGAGCTNAVLLPSRNAEDHCKEVARREPGRYIRFANADPKSEDAIQHLQSAVKEGAAGFGELKYPLALDAPEVLRIYELAADLNVPVLIHFQENLSF